MESRKLTDETLFRQVKSAIAGHDFKAARKTLESHLDVVQDNPRVWELYGNVLKKLGKIDKARSAFERRDELRRDVLVFERLADDVVALDDLDYLTNQQQAYTHEQYVYGMENDIGSALDEIRQHQNMKFGCVLTRKSSNVGTKTSTPDEVSSSAIQNQTPIPPITEHDQGSVSSANLESCQNSPQKPQGSPDDENKLLLFPSVESDFQKTIIAAVRPETSLSECLADATNNESVPFGGNTVGRSPDEMNVEDVVELITPKDIAEFENLLKQSTTLDSGEQELHHLDGMTDDWLCEDVAEISEDSLVDFKDLDEESSLADYALFNDDIYAIDPDKVVASSEDVQDIFSAAERITILQRAERLAAVFIHQHDWPHSELDLLTHVFAVKTVGPVLKFLNGYAEIGMQPDELRLAYMFREIWHQYPKYWLALYRNGDSAATYCNVSWSQSLRIIRVLDRRQHGALDGDILQENLERMYETWFCNRQLRSSYHSFYAYLNSVIRQVEEDEILLEYETGFGRLSDVRQLAYSDIGDPDLFNYQVIEELESYGYSFDRGTYRAMRCCEEIIYDDAFYNQHRRLLADTSNKDEHDE